MPNGKKAIVFAPAHCSMFARRRRLISTHNPMVASEIGPAGRLWATGHQARIAGAKMKNRASEKIAIPLEERSIHPDAMSAANFVGCV